MCCTQGIPGTCSASLLCAHLYSELMVRNVPHRECTAESGSPDSGTHISCPPLIQAHTYSALVLWNSLCLSCSAMCWTHSAFSSWISYYEPQAPGLCVLQGNCYHLWQHCLTSLGCVGLHFFLMVLAKGILVLTIPLDPKLPTKAHRIVFSHRDPDQGMEENRKGREGDKWQQCEFRLFSQVFCAQDLEKDMEQGQMSPLLLQQQPSLCPGMCLLLLAPAWASPPPFLW